jgi:hypothetical protein
MGYGLDLAHFCGLTASTDPDQMITVHEVLAIVKEKFGL